MELFDLKLAFQKAFDADTGTLRQIKSGPLKFRVGLFNRGAHAVMWSLDAVASALLPYIAVRFTLDFVVDDVDLGKMNKVFVDTWHPAMYVWASQDLQSHMTRDQLTLRHQRIPNDLDIAFVTLPGGDTSLLSRKRKSSEEGVVSALSGTVDKRFNDFLSFYDAHGDSMKFIVIGCTHAIRANSAARREMARRLHTRGFVDLNSHEFSCENVLPVSGESVMMMFVKDTSARYVGSFQSRAFVFNAINAMNTGHMNLRQFMWHCDNPKVREEAANRLIKCMVNYNHKKTKLKCSDADCNEKWPDHPVC